MFPVQSVNDVPGSYMDVDRLLSTTPIASQRNEFRALGALRADCPSDKEGIAQ